MLTIQIAYTETLEIIRKFFKYYECEIIFWMYKLHLEWLENICNYLKTFYIYGKITRNTTSEWKNICFSSMSRYLFLFDCKTIFCHRLDKKQSVFIVWVDKVFSHPIYTIFDIMGKQKVLCLIVRLYKSFSFNSMKENYVTEHPFTCHLNFLIHSLKI